MGRAESFIKRHVSTHIDVAKPAISVSNTPLSSKRTFPALQASTVSMPSPCLANATTIENRQEARASKSTTQSRSRVITPVTAQHGKYVNRHVIPELPLSKTSSIGWVLAACLIVVGVFAWLVNIEETATTGEIPVRTLTVRQLDDFVTPRVLAILTEHGSGSGFPLTARDVLTNRHVVEDVGEGASVKVFNEKWDGLKNGTVHWISKKGDLAWIQLDEDIPVTPLKIADEKLQRGDKVYAYGYPKQAYRFGIENLNVRATEGAISAVDMPHEGALHYEHTAAINNGNSGGPLFNNRGEVVGVNTWMFNDANSAYYAIEIGELRKVFHSLWDMAHGQKPNYYEFRD